MEIVPAILATTFEDFKRDLAKVQGLFSYIHLDVMDGKFVPHSSFSEIQQLNKMNELPQIELHLMVKDPIAHMRAWREIENVFRVLVHQEAPGDPLHLINFARKEGWDVGLVLNPETSLSEAENVLEKIDVLQFMTVHPGTQGAPFVPEVLEKIRAFTSNRPTCSFSHEPVLCAADGHVTRETIGALREAGVDIFNVGSALVKADDVQKACEELKMSLRGA